MSKIEWTGETWNPIVGCSIVSPGCTNCYAMRTAARIARMSPKLEHYKGLTQPSKGGPVWTGKVAIAEDALTKPLKRRTPTTYFVNSMSDLFHEDVPDDWIDRVFAVMALTPQHTFQVLTKRSARMRDYVSELARGSETAALMAKAGSIARESGKPELASGESPVWPLPNVWLGVSAEDQRRADERVPDLIDTPAAVRFVSAEPLLGPLDFTTEYLRDKCGGRYPFPMLAREDRTSRLDLIDWIIVGGESGFGAREFKLGWARDIVRQCQAAGVAVFVKQIGSRPTDCHDGIELPVAIKDRKGGAMAEWPNDLCVRQMPGRALAPSAEVVS